MENWPVRKKKKRYRGLILALLMLVPAGYIGVQMVQVLAYELSNADRGGIFNVRRRPLRRDARHG